MHATMIAGVMVFFLLFVLKHKRLSRLEILLVWQTTFLLYASTIFILDLNWRLLSMKRTWPEVSIEMVNQLFIVPICITWLMDATFDKRWLHKLPIFALCALLLTTVHGLMIVQKIMTYSEHWHLVYTFGLFFLLIMIVECVRNKYQQRLRSEVRPS